MKHIKSLGSISLLALLLSFQAYADTDTEVIDEADSQVEHASDHNHSHEATATGLAVQDPEDADSANSKKAKEKKEAKQEEIVPLTEENTEDKTKNVI